jgi:transcriptional regulator of aromatic amino acid metabolism
MKTYEINLDDFEIDVIASIDFNTSTIEDATLAGIVEQIKQQTEPQEN